MSYREKDIPAPKIVKPDDVIIKVEAASICGSDIHGLAVPPGQYMKPGIIYGHEFSGVVAEVGDEVTGFAVGDRVAVNPRVRCGSCYECTHGRGDLCSNSDHYGQLADGGFAEYARTSAKQLYHVADGVSLDLAAQTRTTGMCCQFAQKSKSDTDGLCDSLRCGSHWPDIPAHTESIRRKNLIMTAKGEDRVAEAKACGADIVVDVE